MKWLLFTALLVLAAFAPGFAFEFMTGHGNGLGQAQILSQASPSALLNVPAGGFQRGEWRVETGFMRPYELKELDQAFLAAGWRWRNVTGSFGFSQLGQRDYYSERTAKWSVGYQYGHWAAGGTFSVLSYAFGGRYDGVSSTALGLGAGYRRAPFYVAVSADNLNSPVLDRGSPTIRPVYSIFAEFHSSRTLSTVSRMRGVKGEPPQFAVGQRIAVSPVSALMWGLQSGPVQFGGGVEIGVAKGTISYTASYHPVLGLSHTIAVAYGTRTKSEGHDGFK